MTWMLTRNAAAFDLRWIEQDRISVLDIAHHLSIENRYCGATCRPESVAEHSLLVCWILEHQRGCTDPSALMAALMHDAHEAYTKDLHQPMKQLLGAPWKVEEHRIQHAVLQRFGLLTAFKAWSAEIHWCDMTALATERRQLMPEGGPLWEVEVTHAPLPETTWRFADREAMTWQDWRHAFLERFAELQYAREELLRDLTGQLPPVDDSSQCAACGVDLGGDEPCRGEDPSCPN